MATISHHHVTASLEGVRQRGGSQQLLLERAGINPALVQRGGRVHTDQVARLFKSVQEQLDDEFMGFTAQPCRVGLFATMCELVAGLRSLGELLERACDFYNLVNPSIAMQLERRGQQAALAFTMAEPERDPDHFMREFWLVIWHRFPSWMIGAPIPLLETHFAFAAPAHRDELAIMFPGKLRFNRSANRLLFDAEQLQRPLLRSQQELNDYLRHAPADVMTIPGRETTVERRLERLIHSEHRSNGRLPGLQQVAAAFGMSAQTLHRRLREEGSSYQKVKDNYRREYALAQLHKHNLSVEQLSQQLGFAEPRSFTRAFKGWTGLSPRRYLRARSGAAATVSGRRQTDRG